MSYYQIVVCWENLPLSSTSSHNHFTSNNNWLALVSNMVHLASVKPDAELDAPISKKLESVKIADWDESDSTLNVYGSRYASEGLPTGHMPENEMPPDIAYRLIKDHLALDGSPALNLAS